MEYRTSINRNQSLHCISASLKLRAVATTVKYVAKRQQEKLRVVECPWRHNSVKNRCIKLQFEDDRGLSAGIMMANSCHTAQFRL